MENLKKLIAQEECRGVMQSVDGSLHYFMHQGVVDSYKLVTTCPGATQDATLVDRVIGCGAAFLAVKGNIKSVYAFTMSTRAKELLQASGVRAECDREVEFIVNRAGDGLCPVEALTQGETDIDAALGKIKKFLESKGII